MHKKITVVSSPPPFFFKCECKAVSISEVAVSSPLVLPVDACARLFHPLWRVMAFCIAAALRCQENGLRCRGWTRGLRSCEVSPGFAPVIAPPWAGSCSGLPRHRLPTGRVPAQSWTPGRTTLPRLMRCLLPVGWHAMPRHFQRLVRADGPQQRASIE